MKVGRVAEKVAYMSSFSATLILALSSSSSTGPVA
jgi:hypothetical protein